jgi:hypothetical protein
MTKQSLFNDAGNPTAGLCDSFSLRFLDLESDDPVYLKRSSDLATPNKLVAATSSNHDDW